MTSTISDRIDVTQVGLIVVGLLAGGATWYLTQGALPPAAVMAVAFVAMLVEDRYL